ncbi:universal stress protein UspA [Candidatus Tenderia electrophaga]|uniref:Universal stress protein UspA n=1 Tax=Candidatus Tenderia electrophaga TaxID=1748243 RepID=A0A0S2T977_9GAMM|nr:universal stress protein UspA [Candidatus Tenderia electrophaga]
MTKNVMACIDGSRAAETVCDYAAWASLRLEAPLVFLHVLDKSEYPVKQNLSGNIGLGSREALLKELAELDEKRAKLAMEQGRMMLEAAQQRAVEDGVGNATTLQRHGELVDTVAELEDEIRLLVMGRQGEEGDSLGEHIGTHVENVVRTLDRPILLTANASFKTPAQIMVAFDGSATTRKGVEMIAASPLFKGLPCHVVMVGNDSPENLAHLDWARQALEAAGFEAITSIHEGGVEDVLREYRRQHGIDMLVMGAYGHSRIRRFLVGSTTTKLIRDTTVPLLLLR